MHDSAKYLIHADIVADGVVERSDVVGAVFGQTEGLLGSELDLRALQESSKVGRIDVEIESEGGRSYGEVTIASGLDKVETAILAAALETIDRVGPCRADFQVSKLEDVRAAKRREVVERATDLLAEFEGEVARSADLVEEVRQAVRVEDITEYEGLPAGPRVSDSDAIIVVEGRADVLQLLKYGIKNAVAVEGTDVPEAVADLTCRRTVTAFFDGDRGGDLILKELGQVGEVDYVAFAPEHRSVEDLARDEVMTALREKVPMEAVAGASSPHETVAATDGSARPAPPETADEPESTATADASGTASAEQCEGATVDATRTDDDSADDGDAAATDDATTPADNDDTADAPAAPETLAGHVEAVVDADSGEVVLLDSEFQELASAPASEAFDTVADADVTPTTVVLDGELDQRVLDVAAQRGVEQIVPRSTGEFVKQPTGVRIRTADQF
ncbi:Toprim domain-containing protein [Halorientalis persicus]|uniref:DNA primase DnaG n=1 Tax=Halorientalis persicus TaxID=1367881 RepID=A0A1H8D0N4_9EURY|nr:DNA primase DnaG [Halorientalis persicus]SEN00776.1 Toprim domain-containing protein [Halorientalis persicus]